MNKILKIYLILTIFVVMGVKYNWYINHKYTQPIKFSHRLHAGDLGIDCRFCHEFVATSISATIPSVKKCMECHKSIATDKPEIIKLKKYYDEETEPDWIKVHNIKDFVYFTHKRHILAGISCFECHGRVDAMDEIRQVKSLNMGFCINCHRLKNASIDCLTCHK